ncbi:MAG: PAS domain-containing protein [Fimbriimonadaceae bacterium]|nr:PAS domain-containing protein [Fimbriimonadaceae bacterium]
MGRALLDGLTTQVATWDAAGRLLFGNASFHRSWGAGGEVAVGTALRELLAPEEVAALEALLVRCSPAQPACQGHAILRGRDGRQQHLDYRLVASYESGKSLIGYRLEALESRQETLPAAAAVQQSARVAALYAALPDLVFVQTAEGLFDQIHVPARFPYPVPAEQLLGTDGSGILPAEVLRTISALRQTVAGGGAIGPLEFYLDRGPQRTWLEGRLVRTRAGEFLGIVRDVTLRKHDEAFNQRLAAAVEQSADAIVVTDAECRIAYANPAFAAAIGWPLAALLGQALTAHYDGSEPLAAALLMPLSAAIDAGRAYRGRLTCRRGDGQTYPCDLTLSPIRDPKGGVAAFVALERDVSETVQLEAQLRQAAKMQAVGQLASGVAHDFNNLLTSILGYTGLLTEALPAGSPEQADAVEVLRAAERAAALTGQLLEFSRRRVLQPRCLGLNSVVNGLVGLLGRLVGENVQMTVELDPTAGTVVADGGQLEQVLMNLVVNAKDALPYGGRLTVATSSTTLEAPLELPQGALPAGRYAVLQVADTGVGMDLETQRQIFEPFFTTKAGHGGTGLGLAMVASIVGEAGGGVECRSQPGSGSAFRVLLPQVDAAPDELPPGLPHDLPTGHGERVLVVEDEPGVLSMVERTLRMLGYEVLAAADATQALVLATDAAQRLDLLLTDVLLPGLDGVGLAQLLCAERPHLAVLYLSGYSANVLSDRGVDPRSILLLSKPFGPRQLALAVRQALLRSRR